MTSTHEKKINNLGKPENNLIIPNKYTLDLLPLSLFYVDILDSQTSANIFSAGKHQREKYHMI